MSATPNANGDQHSKSTIVEAQSPPVWKPALKEAAKVFGIAWIVIIVGYIALFKEIHPGFIPFMGRDAEPRVIPAQAFRQVVGSGFLSGGNRVVSEFTNGQAILVSDTRFVAEDYPFIQVNIEGLTTWAYGVVFWRTAAEPDEINTMVLQRSWDAVTQVAMVYGNEKYRGEIIELTVGFVSDPTDHDNNGEPITLIDVELRPFSPLRVAQQIIEDWRNPPLWGGDANNKVRGIHENGMVFPNAVANLLVVTGVLLAWMGRRWRKLRFGQIPQVRLLAVALCLCLYGWAFNDILRWHWRIAQLLDTHERYAGLPLEQRIRNNPVRCGRRDDCFEHLLPYF